MKFVITVIFILSSGERVVDTAYTSNLRFCETTTEMYKQLGRVARQQSGGQLQDVIAFCRSAGEESSV